MEWHNYQAFHYPPPVLFGKIKYLSSSSIIVHDLFMTCSWLPNDLFMTCSWLVHDLFMTCSLHVLDLSITFSQLFHDLFITCHDVFLICSCLIHYSSILDLRVTSSWLAHCLFIACLWLSRLYLFINFTWLVRKFFLICSWLLCNFHMTCSIRLKVLFMTYYLFFFFHDFSQPFHKIFVTSS